MDSAALVLAREKKDLELSTPSLSEDYAGPLTSMWLPAVDSSHGCVYFAV